MNFDFTTFVVWVAILPVWLIWETVVLKTNHKTISQVARRRGWQFTAAVFFWTSMPFHWWCPSPVEQFTAGTVIFWVIIAALFVYNVRTWKRHALPLEQWPTWERWLNWPVFYLVAGPIAAVFLFPQRQPTPWLPW